MRARVQRRRRRREHEEEEEERQPVAAETVADRVLDLQKTAGNRATGAALARWGMGRLPLAEAPAWPKAPEVRFGSDLVVPLEAVSDVPGAGTAKGREEDGARAGGDMHVTLQQGDHTAALFQAATQGRRFDVVDVIVTRGNGTGIRYTLKNVYISAYQVSGTYETLTLSYEKREFSHSPPPRR